MEEVITISSDEGELEQNVGENDLVNEKNETKNSNRFNRSFDSQKNCSKPKREFVYEATEHNIALEKEIDKLRILSDLSPDHIEYMVLRDINYFIDIFSGSCDHSWRHEEFKKFSKRSGNLLYENSAMTSYTQDQYMSAVKALQSIFCKKNNKYDEYIVKVLLPEALIKICMRIYQCSKYSAEEFLKKNNIQNSFADCPMGSIIYTDQKKKK